MKNFFLLIFLLTFSILFSQNDIEKLNFEKNILIEEIKNYVEAYNSQNFKAQVNYYPESIADSISKKELVEELELFHSQNPKSKKEFDIEFKIDTLLIENSNVYSRIQLLEKNTIDFSKDKNNSGMDYAVSRVYNEMISEFGKDNVELNRAESKLVYLRKVELYGIKNIGLSWKFIESINNYPLYFPKGIK